MPALHFTDTKVEDLKVPKDKAQIDYFENRQGRSLVLTVGSTRKTWSVLFYVHSKPKRKKLGYFGYHAFTGFYGIQSMDRLEADASRLSAELAALKLERSEFERRAEMLRSDNLDADIVDVEARAALNRLRPDEVVIMLDRVQQNAD